jgi:hypothetical protein
MEAATQAREPDSAGIRRQLGKRLIIRREDRRIVFWVASTAPAG